MAAKAVTVTLGPMAKTAEAMMESGRYATMSELVREGLRALQRQEAMFDAMVKAKVQEALDDPRPDLTPEEADAFIWGSIRARRGEV